MANKKIRINPTRNARAALPVKVSTATAIIKITPIAAIVPTRDVHAAASN
jgi:cellulase/cellobiase CelA1